MSHTTNAGQQSLDDDTRAFAYAGVGARQAPTTRSRPAHCAPWRR